uniref:Uncharacterized protein n=1 Tax=Quercus lobata TaxID=97700 RepID=A0A7N2LY47_QUELO
MFFFFPDCSILETKDSRSDSYAWKSILKGWDVLLRGSQWWIGDGKFVKIWQNHWLPRKHPPLVLSPIVPSMEDATVDIMIEAETRQRSHDLIDGIFAPQEAKLIITIPLARIESDNIVFWLLAKDGKYTRKSGYHFLKEEADLEQHEDRSSRISSYGRGFGLCTYPTRLSCVDGGCFP